MDRYRLPDDLTPQEERAVLAALEEAFGSVRQRPSAWALAGRVEAVRLGALQARRETGERWTLRANVPFARKGTTPLVGRGDAK
jgi:hypothetical protein